MWLSTGQQCSCMPSNVLCRSSWFDALPPTRIPTHLPAAHTLPAGLLHDTVEDCGDLVGLDEINFHFGPAVRRIVEGETKFRWGLWEGRLWRGNPGWDSKQGRQGFDGAVLILTASMGAVGWQDWDSCSSKRCSDSPQQAASAAGACALHIVDRKLVCVLPARSSQHALT